MRRFLDHWKKLMAAIAATAVVAGPVAAVGWDQYSEYAEMRTIVHEVAKHDLDTIAEQVASNTRSILAQRFFELEKKRTTYGLTPAEYNEFCSIGRRLGYFTSCPSARG